MFTLTPLMSGESGITARPNPAVMRFHQREHLQSAAVVTQSSKKLGKTVFFFFLLPASTVAADAAESCELQRARVVNTAIQMQGYFWGGNLLGRKRQ